MSANNTLFTAALLDSISRFVGNVGVPATIAFFILYQITPRLDQLATLQTQANTNLAVISATCGTRQLVDQIRPLVP